MNTCTIEAQQKSQLNWGQYGITHLLWVGAGTAPDLEGGAVFFPDVGTAGASCNRNVIVLSIVPILLGQAGVADGGRKCERRAGIRPSWRSSEPHHVHSFRPCPSGGNCVVESRQKLAPVVLTSPAPLLMSNS